MSLEIVKKRSHFSLRPFLSLLGILAAVSGIRAEDTQQAGVQVKAPLKLSSFAQVLYSRIGSSTDSFSVSRARLTLDGTVTRSIRLRMTWEAAKSPVLLEASADLTPFRNGTVRLGQFKVPFSRESLTSASDHDFINLPASVLALSPGRDIGASGRDIGALVQIKSGILEGSAGIFNGAGINRADLNREKDWAGRLVLSPGARLKLGASVYRGLYSAAAGAEPVRRDRAGMELEAGVSRLDVKGEWIVARDGIVSKRGGYAQVGAELVSGKLQALIRFDALDRIGSQTPGWNTVWALGVNRFFASKTKLQINLEWKHERESGREGEFSLLALFQAGF